MESDNKKSLLVGRPSSAVLRSTVHITNAINNAKLFLDKILLQKRLYDCFAYNRAVSAMNIQVLMFL